MGRCHRVRFSHFCPIPGPFPVRKRKSCFTSRNPVCAQESGFHHTSWPASLGWAYFLVGRSDSDARHCCLLCLLCSRCPVPVSARTALHHRKAGPECPPWTPSGSPFALLSELLLSSCSEAVDLALLPAPEWLSSMDV